MSKLKSINLGDLDPSIPMVHFIARECELQQSGEMSVAHMVDAWANAELKSLLKQPITIENIQILGKLVEPQKNAMSPYPPNFSDGPSNWRRVEVRVGSTPITTRWREVDLHMTELIKDKDRISPEEFFKRFEEIHPFIDGNGRTGQILYNWLKGTLRAPVWAPDYWNDSRRVPGSGAPKMPECPNCGDDQDQMPLANGSPRLVCHNCHTTYNPEIVTEKGRWSKPPKS